MATQKIILRHPGGVLKFETDRIDIMQNFISWIITVNHFSEYDEKNGIFTFPHSKFTATCFVKWQKLWCN